METDEVLRELARNADRTGGVVARGELKEAGLDDGAIANLIRRGRLVRVGRGVFRFAGSGLSPRQLLRAALLEIATGAAARRWALWVHGIGGAVAPGGRPCLLVPYGASVRGGERWCLHRSRSFSPDQQLVVSGLRVVGVERAVIESWPELPLHRWREVTARALQRGLTTFDAILAELSHLGRVRGSARIARELRGFSAQAPRARSTGELALLAAFARAGLPEPILNHEVRPPGGQRREIDAAYPDLLLGYELDGAGWHSTPDQVQSDQVRDLHLAAVGWIVHRIPARLLTSPAQLERLLRSTFDARSAPHTPDRE